MSDDSQVTFVVAAVDASPGAADTAFDRARALLAAAPELAESGAHAIYASLVLGNVEAVRRELAARPGWVDEKGGPCADFAPLHYVTHSKFHRESAELAAGLLATAGLLLDRGADPNAVYFPPGIPDNPLRPLYGACGVTNFPAMAELLLDRGARIDDNESLYHCLEHADTRCLELLVARGVEPRGTNALHHAFDRPGSERVRLLLAHGADANEPLGKGGPPPLFSALERGCEREVFVLLIEHGADVHARHGDAGSAWRTALRHGDVQVADLLAARGGAEGEEATPYERFAEACGRGDRAAAARLVAESPGLFAARDCQEREAFVVLGRMGKADLLATMIEAGVPVDTQGAGFATALHWAAFLGQRQAVEVLLAHGAPVAVKDFQYHATPQGWAEYGQANWPNPQGDYEGVLALLAAAGKT